MKTDIEQINQNRIPPEGTFKCTRCKKEFPGKEMLIIHDDHSQCIDCAVEIISKVPEMFSKAVKSFCDELGKMFAELAKSFNQEE